MNSEMHLEAAIEQVSACTLRPRSSEFRYPIGGHDRARLEMHMEAAIE